MKRKIRYGKVQLGAVAVLSAMILSSCGTSNFAVKEALNEANGAVQEAVDEANGAVQDAVNEAYDDTKTAFSYGMNKEAASKEEDLSPEKAAGAEAGNADHEAYASGGEQNEVPGPSVESNTDMTAVGEKKIRTVTMTLECKNIENASKELKNRVKAQGGYIESEDFSALNQSNSSTMNFTLRIPKDNVDGFLDFLNGEGRILSKSENLQDVRLQYRDAKSHIKALETEQERILALMDKAETIDQLIALESRLTDIRYQLESYNSEILDYDNRVNFSTIYLELQESVEGKINNTSSYSFSDKVKNGFYKNIFAIQLFFSNLALFLLVYIPQILFVLLVILALVLLNKKLNAKAKKQKEKDAKALKTEDSVKTEVSEEPKEKDTTPKQEDTEKK